MSRARSFLLQLSFGMPRKPILIILLFILLLYAVLDQIMNISETLGVMLFSRYHS